jgi:hypothetical protein
MPMKGSDALVGLGLLLVAGVQFTLLREDHVPQVPTPAAAVAAPRERTSATPSKPKTDAAPTPVVSTAAPSPEVSLSEEPPLLGERWAEAMLDEVLKLHPELKLTPEEVAGLKEVYVLCQNVRTSYEAEIVEVESMNSTHARLRIPPYPAAGAKLQQLFHEELKAELGEERYGDVDDHLGNTFEVAFKWFGASVQLLDVELKRDPDQGLLYRIVARMDFADAVDPELGMNETRLFSTTSHYTFKAETVATGEWRPLARHFPRLPDRW